MSGGALAVIIAAAVAVVVVVAWFLFPRNHPERSATHPGPDRTGSALVHGDVDDRPAGADAEPQGVAGAGEPVPGPSDGSERRTA